MLEGLDVPVTIQYAENKGDAQVTPPSMLAASGYGKALGITTSDAGPYALAASAVALSNPEHTAALQSLYASRFNSVQGSALMNLQSEMGANLQTAMIQQSGMAANGQNAIGV